MNNLEFIEKLTKYQFIDKLFKHEMKYVIEPINNDLIVKDIITIYFTYIFEGSISMPLDKNLLIDNWNKKCQNVLIQEKTNEDEFLNIEKDIQEILEYGLNSINNINLFIDKIDNLSDFFFIDNNYLFSKKFHKAKNGINASSKRIFNQEFESNFKPDMLNIWPTATKEQIKIINEGLNKNLIVTGGPGTGKTTSIFYLLLSLLKIEKREIYLTAPSGKAASRIKESIDEEISKLNEFVLSNFKDEIEILKNVSNYTIHRLLCLDYKTNGFKYNELKQFDKDSIFIIDEASMIDICLFDDLLKAIPKGARVFILGDKYQLPSVECGAVLSDMLNELSFINNIVELKESKRFKKDSNIYKLSLLINNGKLVEDVEFNKLSEMSIIDDEFNVNFYDYSLDESPKASFDNAIKTWARHFYSDYKIKCLDVSFDEFELDQIYERIDEAKILCAENKGKFGVNTINRLIKKEVIDEVNNTLINGFYPGMPIMILKNLKEYDLYNGDTGLIVKFKDFNTLYLLIKKQNENYKEDSKELKDKILKLGKYMLYPLRLLDLNEVSLAYSITIHKAQGSGYKNIMIILPNKEGHPLLNRQIIYTAVTRTKGTTYIVSNKDRLNESIKNEITRYTRIYD